MQSIQPQIPSASPSDTTNDSSLPFRFGNLFKQRQSSQRPQSLPESPPPSPPIRRRTARPTYKPRISSPSSILPSETTAEYTTLTTKLQSSIPIRHATNDWQRVFSTMHHGTSLQTLLTNCQTTNGRPILLFIRDSKNCVFGCYVSTPFNTSSHYYGNGETFVFKLSDDGDLDVFKWTKKNSYFQLTNSDSIALGGGGKFALFIDSMLERGSSGSCTTFDNPCLASNDQFDIVVLEAYSLVPRHRFTVDENNV